MQFLKKLFTALLLLGAAILAVGVSVIGFNNQGWWTLLYLIEAGLLLMYAYVYLPVFLTLAAFPRLKRLARSVVSSSQGATYFAILVPAHNEARLLPQLLASLKAQTYSKERFQIFVVADNCSDNTAELARRGGATCFERYTSRPSNKGQALAYAWDKLQARSEVSSEAVILLVDGDCQLEPNFLAELDRTMSKPGSAPVVQSFRYVSNSRSSNVSTLDAAAEALRQWVQLGSRKLLGLESQICGSGVAFRRTVFGKLMAGQQHGLVEDKAWRAGLFEDGLKVDWCPSARLSYEAVEDNAAFQKQRKRWVGGQIALIKAFAAKLIWHGLTRLNLSELDCAMTIIQLPRSFMLMLAGLLGTLAFVLPEASLIPWWGWFALAGLFMVYAAFGLFLIQAETRHYLRLLLAPLLVVGVARTTLSSLLGKGVRRWDPTRGATIQQQPQLQAAKKLD